MSVQLVEIPAISRRGHPIERIRSEEGSKMLAQINSGDWVVALDVTGRTYSTKLLSKKLDDWQMRGGDVAFLIGGADGLAPSCLARADETLSLSAFTFPHFLVRVILAEQLYRAWTLLTGHPYHRA